MGCCGAHDVQGDSEAGRGRSKWTGTLLSPLVTQEDDGPLWPELNSVSLLRLRVLTMLNSARATCSEKTVLLANRPAQGVTGMPGLDGAEHQAFPTTRGTTWG